MNIFDLLNQSQVGREQCKKLQKNISANSQSFYPWIKEINNFLKDLSEEQLLILKEKFKNFGNLSQLYDKLSEILVACRFADERPKFLNDNEGKPDIHLQKSNRYIEVKRVNISDEEEQLINKLLETKTINIRNISNKMEPQDNMRNALLNKAKEHIAKAVNQLNDNLGTIFLIYKLDLTGYVNSQEAREVDFEKEIKNYFMELNFKNQDQIKLEILEENKLFSN